MIHDEARRASVHFEGVQIAMTKTKDGYVLKLAIHPNDVPESLLRDLVGSRYMVAMCKLDDENHPVHPPEKTKADRMVASAGMLCREPTFWKYLEDIGAGFSITNEEEAKTSLKNFLNVGSRAELKSNEQARNLWMQMLSDFRSRSGA